MLFHKVCGIDLGTDTIKIKDKHGKHFLYSRNLLAVRKGGQVLAVGDEAYEMYEKNPENVDVIWPMAEACQQT